MDILLNTTLEKHIYSLIEPALSKTGYEIVRVKLIEGGKRATLQIMADKIEGDDFNISDCEKISKFISVLLDVEGPIEQQYDLEVSSCGIDRPLTRLKDFVKYQNYEISVELYNPVNNSRKFRGKIIKIENNNITLKPNITSIKKDKNIEEDNIINFNFEDVKKAKLVLNDELLSDNKKNLIINYKRKK